MGKAKTSTFATGPVGGEMTEYKVTHATQCHAKDFWCNRQCQGVYRHKGPHWCYRPDGWLEQWQQKKDIKGPWDWASRSCPPDHKDYIHPKDMQASYFRSHDKREVLRTFKDDEPPLPKRLAKRLDNMVKKIKKRGK